MSIVRSQQTPYIRSRAWLKTASDQSNKPNKSATIRIIHSQSTNMKLFISTLALVFISANAFSIDKKEANQLVNSRVRRGGMASDSESECAEKKCNWEEYLEGAENVAQAQRGADLREELKSSKRSGQNWHKDLFDQYYTDCYDRVATAGLDKEPFNFGNACFNTKFVVKREEYYSKVDSSDSNY